MATLAGKQSNVIAMLRSIVELDYDAIEAYEAAIARLDDASFRRQMTLFAEDHRSHVADLNPMIQELGGEPVLAGDIKRVLTKGKVVMASLVGDRAILAAMKTNEEDTNTAYERAVGHAGVPASVMNILHLNLGDERRHRAWIIQALDAMKPERASVPSIL